ncbi:snRNA-activating protein complex subunit 3 [Angomonas deanei]|nr:snRNA-activating protein complex subunit 3 [Angomonas deanei]|eukprot:EPY28093.1 snRNA-activating protein complex subunit 3 [Angomonas deanei]
MAQRKTEVLEKFTQNTNSLFCFKPEYQNCMKSSQREISDNALTPGTMTTCTDSSDDFCVNPHTQRLEFMFFFGNGYAADSVWAVLPCQKLTVLIDAVRCTLGACPPLNARNAFLFIAGVFYIDDRHKGEEGYEDISALIRNHDPTGTATDSWQACNAGFGKCPVKSAAETTFSEIRLKMGDWCVLRHEGGLCSHMFYLREITPLGENSRKERSQFPHRTALRSGLPSGVKCAVLSPPPSVSTATRFP